MILFRPKYNQRLFSRGHRFQIGQAIGEFIARRTKSAIIAGMKQGMRFPREARRDVDPEAKKRKSLLDIRAGDAKAKSAFFEGMTDRHPHGLSGQRFVIPHEESKNCWDTAPHASEASEYGNDAGGVSK